MLTLHNPSYEDLWFKRLMLSDEETMSYNHAWGGTIPFPEELWRSWYDRWIADPKGERYYRYVKDASGRFIGEIAYHYDADLPGFLADVLIYARYRGNGFGRRALELLCSAAKENGIPALYDEIAIDNPAVELFRKHGFSEERRTEDTILLKKVL